MMSDEADAGKARFGRYLVILTFVSMLEFVFRRYRDPWPTIVSPPFSPAPEVPTAAPPNTLSLATPPSSESNGST